MPIARRMSSAISDAERASLKDELRRELLGELRDSLSAGDHIQDAALNLEERLESYEPQPLTIEQVREMDAASINSRWTDVAAALEASGHAASHADAPTPPTNGTVKTGQGLLNEHRGPETLSWEALRAMPVEEHQRRRQEIDQWIASQGASS